MKYVYFVLLLISLSAVSLFIFAAEGKITESSVAQTLSSHKQQQEKILKF